MPRRVLTRLALPALAVAVTAPLALLPAAGAPAAVSAFEPTFRSYPAEPTLGVNLETGNVMFIAGLQTYRINEFDKSGPGTSTWTDVSTLITSIDTADPILETDTTTGRTFVNQLMYSNPGSVMAYTDDDGATWTPVPFGAPVGFNIDHQTVGFGKWVPGSPFSSVNGYPNAIYYCTNDLAVSSCGVSLDGGNTFTPSRPAYSLDECAAIHGHLKSAPDGTIYLPPDGCSGDGGTPAGVVVSEDNSFSWSVRTVPGSDSGDAGHPSLGIATDGTLYLAYGSKSEDGAWGPTQVAKSSDKGETWTKPYTLGADLGITATSFPIAVAGDPDRAAVGFLGTTAEGNPRDQANFHGRWDLYISTTYDGGKTWRTVNVTPDSPVQVGSICTNGTTCGSDRNLLDFNDMVIDERGRVLVALADGCTKAVCTTEDRQEHGLVVRQASGNGLLSEFDDGTGSTGPTAAPSTDPVVAVPSAAVPSALPTRAAPVRPPAAHPSTGVPPVLPVAAAGAAAVAVVLARRRRRASAASAASAA
jgi:hypothetical protein